MDYYVTGTAIRSLRETKGMTKEHYISFLMVLSDREIQFVKLYPEGNAESRFRMNGVRVLYAYCNRHGLFQCRIRRERKLL